ncbi:MAG: UDP-N-acetylmuramoyl-L-alanyl-D-glutamate--2,6-diaminopimelate ligase [Phycisphaerales bacterium]|nr:MAG: UDP-N-acetylmuramoyl-L-alanyl-D-glutamate--2,6-diaminopimelate ligase [Phycisphaerales bacterium]
MKEPTRSAASPVWPLPDLLAHAGVEPLGETAPPRVSISSLTCDSREVHPGSCFVAVCGTESDGHRYVQAALEAGAVAIVADREKSLPASAAILRFHDTRETLAKLAAAYYGLRGDGAKPLRLVGITGTNGKTTVAWLLRSILRAAGHRPALLGTIEYDLLAQQCKAPLTTPGPVDLCRHLATARDAGADTAVLEVSSHALDQRRTDGLEFNVGVFTNLSGDHLDYHGTMDAYWQAKRRLFDALGADAVTVVNYDDPVGELMASNLAARVLSFATESPQADVTARVDRVDLSGSRFLLKGPSFELQTRCALVGRHNVMNVLAAAGAAHALGVTPEAILGAVESFEGVPGRLQRVEPEDCPFSVLVDYAHTDDALNHALRAVRPMTTGRLVCVFGCGGDRDRSKRPRMAAVVGKIADAAYVTSDNSRTEDPQEIIDDILPGFGSDFRCRVVVRVDRKEAIELALADARAGDTIVIAGKGHETYQLVGDKVLSFDDVTAARNCLRIAQIKEDVA